MTWLRRAGHYVVDRTEAGGAPAPDSNWHGSFRNPLRFEERCLLAGRAASHQAARRSSERTVGRGR